MQKSMLSSTIAILAGLVVLSASTAHATLIGDTITSVFETPNLLPGDNLWDGTGGATTGTPIAAVVGAGVEYSVTFSGPAGDGTFFADIGANSLSIGIFHPISFAIPIGDNVLYDFMDLDLPGSIANVLLTSSTFSGVTFSFGLHSIHVEIPDQDIPPGPGGTTNFDIIAAQAIPEPGTITLMGLGLAGLVLYRWRRR